MTYANFGSSHPGSHPIFSWLWSRWTGLPGRTQPATSSRRTRPWRSGTLRGRSVWWWRGPNRPGPFATIRPRLIFEPWVASRVICAAAGPAAFARPVAGRRAPCAQSVTGITSCAPVAARRGCSSTKWLARATEEVLEVSGYHDEAGRFVTLDPPVRMATAAIPRQSDGSFDTDELMRLIARSRRVDTAAGPRAA